MKLLLCLCLGVAILRKSSDLLVQGFVSPHTRANTRWSPTTPKPLHTPFGCRVKSSSIPVSMAESAMDEDELKIKDPVGAILQESRSLDFNAVVNIGVILCIVLAFLTKLSTVDSGLMRGWTVEEMAVRIPIDNWQSYSAILEAAPISTKAVTSATVYTIGDVISQATEGVEIGQLDRPRILRSMLAGLIGHGPLSHLWYDWSEGIFNNVLHWTEWWSFIPKVVLDQTTWGPFWNNTYILLLGLFKREGLDTIFEEMKRTTVPLIISGLKLWPLAHCITYGLIPVENRLLWVDLVEILWVTILATAASGAAATIEAKDSTS